MSEVAQRECPAQPGLQLYQRGHRGDSLAEEKAFLAEPRNVVHSVVFCSKLLYR